MPKAWEKAPIGGEITSSPSMSTLLGNNLEELTDEAKAAHLTFLGPNVAKDIGDGQAAYWGCPFIWGLVWQVSTILKLKIIR